MGGDGHNVGQRVLSVAFHFESIRGYTDDGEIGVDVLSDPPCQYREL